MKNETGHRKRPRPREIREARKCLGPGTHGGGCDKMIQTAPCVRMCNPCRNIVMKMGYR